MAKFLIIQTAFIGDVILATPLIEQLHFYFPQAQIDFLLRKGNEGLLQDHPFINKLYIWDKKKGKYANLISFVKIFRNEKYDYAINLQRFFSTGLLTVLSGAKSKIGFSKNPWSFLFSESYSHIIDTSKGLTHEIDRNLLLLSGITNSEERQMPRLYPSASDQAGVPVKPYITMSPTSVWYTKQYPPERWIEVIKLVPSTISIYLLGGKSDFETCENIRNAIPDPENIVNMAGKFTFLQSAAYMKTAKMNYVNDSAPLHMASAMEAPVTAVFCSTTPKFGFGPLHLNSRIVESFPPPKCKPCGLHGYKACPENHFKCAEIDPAEVLGNI
jgi:heptosyltransferase-2